MIPRYPHYLTSIRKQIWPHSVASRTLAPLLSDIRDAIATHKSVLWVTPNLANMWANCGLYSWLQHGAISLDSDLSTSWTGSARRRFPSLEEGECNDKAFSAGEITKLMSLDTGCWINQDPPNIIKLFIPGLLGSLTWIDSRNWEMDLPDVPLYYEVLDKCRLGAVKLTLGAQAMHGFRSNYLSDPIFCHNDTDALACEGRAYYGGRCECFFVGEVPEKVYHLDMRSCYGAVMKEYILPVRLIDQTNNPEGNLRNCIADVDLETDQPIYPCQSGADVLWPVGRFRTTLCGPELSYAKLHGHIKHIRRAFEYQFAPVLSGYASALWKQRGLAEQQGRTSLAKLIKHLIVALPGKLGQRSKTWVRAPEQDWQEDWGEWLGTGPDGQYCRYRCMNGLAFRLETGGYAANSCPAIAAWINSAARMRLWYCMEVAGRENVYYVDTDSLFVNGKGYAKLHLRNDIMHNGIGGLCKKTGAAKAVLYGIKTYSSSGNITAAGLTRGTVSQGPDLGHYWFHTKKVPPDQEASGCPPEHELRAWPGPEEYRHGRVDSDGKVHPHFLSEF